MHRDQKVFANKLVQFEIVHVAACANFWCVHDEKHVIRIHMDPWNVVAILLSAIAMAWK